MIKTIEAFDSRVSKVSILVSKKNGQPFIDISGYANFNEKKEKLPVISFGL